MSYTYYISIKRWNYPIKGSEVRNCLIVIVDSCFFAWFFIDWENLPKPQDVLEKRQGVFEIRLDAFQVSSRWIADVSCMGGWLLKLRNQLDESGLGLVDQLLAGFWFIWRIFVYACWWDGQIIKTGYKIAILLWCSIRYVSLWGVQAEKNFGDDGCSLKRINLTNEKEIW
jgi:hypothetical protein